LYIRVSLIIKSIEMKIKDLKEVIKNLPNDMEVELEIITKDGHATLYDIEETITIPRLMENGEEETYLHLSGKE